MDHGVTHVLNAAAQLDNRFPEDFVYLKLNLKDNSESDPSKYFREACRFIEDARVHDGRVLVHCVAGEPRHTVHCVLRCRFCCRLADAH